MGYPWYEPVNGADLQQGDIIFDCPVLFPSYAGEKPEDIPVEVQTLDLIVLTQSCDLAHDKAQTVLLCPLYTLDQCMEEDDYFRSKNGRDQLRRGNLPGQHLLNSIELEEHPELNRPFSVVFFTDPVTIPLAYLKELLGQRRSRPRLLPPYREELAQAFARYFMRVGLPLDIDKNELLSYRK